MNIKTTNGVVFGALQAAAQLAGRDMPGVVALKVSRIVRALEPEFRAIETHRQKLLEAYVQRDEQGNKMPELDASGKPIPNKLLVRQEYRDEQEKLFAGEVEFELVPLRTSDVEAIPGVTPAILLDLGPFFVDTP